VQVHGQSHSTATKRIQKYTLLYCKSSRFVSEIVFFIFSTVSICLVRKCFLYLRIVDIMLIIPVIAVRLYAHLNVDFYGRFMPSST